MPRSTTSESHLSNHPLLHAEDRVRVVGSRPNEILWHFSSVENPESILANGFQARNPNAGVTIKRWGSSLIPSQFISTTRNRNLSQDFPVYSDRRYRFKIDTAHNVEKIGIDVNATLGSEHREDLKNEEEVALLGRIAAAAVTSVYDEFLDRTGRWDKGRQRVEWMVGNWQNPTGSDGYFAGMPAVIRSSSGNLLEGRASRDTLREFTSGFLQAAQNGPVTVRIEDSSLDPGARWRSGPSVESVLRSEASELEKIFKGNPYPITYRTRGGVAGPSATYRPARPDERGIVLWIDRQTHPDQHVAARLGYVLRGNRPVDVDTVSQLLNFHSDIGKGIHGLDVRFENRTGKGLRGSIQQAADDMLLGESDAQSLLAAVDSGYAILRSPVADGRSVAAAAHAVSRNAPSRHDRSSTLSSFNASQHGTRGIHRSPGR